MADELFRVYQNFIWKIEGITPRATLAAERFRYFDPEQVQPSESAGATRLFVVEWDESSQGLEYEDTFARFADHLFAVDVVYSADYTLLNRTNIMLNDRHDILAALRHEDSWSGYNADNPATDIGLKDRQYIATKRLEDDDFFVLRLEFNCKVLEVE